MLKYIVERTFSEAARGHSVELRGVEPLYRGLGLGVVDLVVLVE